MEKTKKKQTVKKTEETEIKSVNINKKEFDEAIKKKERNKLKEKRKKNCCEGIDRKNLPYHYITTHKGSIPDNVTKDKLETAAKVYIKKKLKTINKMFEDIQKIKAKIDKPKENILNSEQAYSSFKSFVKTKVKKIKIVKEETYDLKKMTEEEDEEEEEEEEEEEDDEK